MMPEAREVLSEMIGNGITPDTVIYNCLINKYQKLGNIEEATSLQNEMESVLPSCTNGDTASGSDG
jgi:pentatricopeptide repeat domain-containing protein 1